jgi:hypothetical protein
MSDILVCYLAFSSAAAASIFLKEYPMLPVIIALMAASFRISIALRNLQ